MTRKFKVPATFTVPDTIEGVRGLMTARGWQKAGIVYAYTRNDGRGRPSKKLGESPQLMTLTEFAALGITGLRKRRGRVLRRSG